MFKLGVPEPIECRLPEGRGVGKTRECVMSTGTVQQKILAWEEPSRLVVQADNPEAVKWYASQIKDTFTLDGFSGSGNNCFAFFFSLFNTCTITRRSEIEARGPIRAAMVWIGMKFVHLHVFRNWKKMLKSRT
jgi:hypothetical protein